MPGWGHPLPNPRGFARMGHSPLPNPQGFAFGISRMHILVRFFFFRAGFFGVLRTLKRVLGKVYCYEMLYPL